MCERREVGIAAQAAMIVSTAAVATAAAVPAMLHGQDRHVKQNLLFHNIAILTMEHRARAAAIGAAATAVTLAAAALAALLHGVDGGQET